MTGILYFHSGDEISGGERSLLALWDNLDCERFSPRLAGSVRGAFLCETKRAGVPVTDVYIPSLRSGRWGAVFYAVKRFRAQIREEKIGLIHSYGPRNNILASLLGKMMRIPVIWHERNLIYGREWDITRLLLFLPDAVIVNSRSVAGRFLRRGEIPAKVRVIWNGTDLERFQPGVDALEIRRALNWGNRKIVGLVSNLNQRKNVEFFLEVAARVSSEDQDALFVIVGGNFGTAGLGHQGSLERQGCLELLSEQLGIRERVYFTGFQADVRPYLAVFDVFCAVTAKEACSRAMVEAMACGKPVVALKDGGNPEIVLEGETGLLVSPGGKEAFARAILSLLKDDSLRSRLGREGRIRVQEFFDVRQNARQVQALYDELLAGKGKGQR